MMTQEENELLTRVGPGAPAGEMLRRYWQPVALAEELPPGGAPKPVRFFGEDLVLFRDDQGRVGLLDTHCSHRGADLSYGRVEDGGLRCIYHGWLYDVQGRCLDQPGEPDGGRNRGTVRHKAYPCQEKAGLIFGYFGPGEPPLLPAYEIFEIADEYRFAYKFYSECNYLQGNEGNIDPRHLSFLHRFFDESLTGETRQGRYRTVGGSNSSPNQLCGENLSPPIELELEDFGVRIYTWRPVGEKAYLRVSNFVMPNLCAVPGETQGAGYLVNWHVPIDDEHHWKFMIVFSRAEPLDQDAFRKRYSTEAVPSYRAARNAANRYLQDRDELKTRSYTGMGSSFPVHDLFATESQGSIQDRTREHLVTSDKAIVAERKQLLKAIKDVQEGRDPLHVIRDPEHNRFPHMVVISEVVPTSNDIKDYVQKVEAVAKEKSSSI